MFSEAIRLDPNSAESWAGLADAYHTMGASGDCNVSSPLARDAANRALQIDPTQAQALMVLGITSAFYEFNLTASEAYFRRSLAARPGYAWSRMLYAVTLAHYGRSEEAIQQAKLASALDPVSVMTNAMAWHVYFCARHYDEALRIILAAAELDPTFGAAHFRLAISWEQKGEYQKAIEAGSKDASLSAAFASGGDRGYWQRRLEMGGGLAQRARWYMRLGKREEALRALEKAYQRHDCHLLLWLPAYEEFDPLRSEPRFQKLRHDLGLSERPVF
jgi:tetratricopeptide (TPR) repeat protein